MSTPAENVVKALEMKANQKSAEITKCETRLKQATLSYARAETEYVEAKVRLEKLTP